MKVPTSLESLIVTVQRLALPFLMLAGLAAACAEDDPCSCNTALAQDLIKTVNTKSRVQAFLRIVDEKTFLDLKQPGSPGLSLPLLGNLLKSAASYADFSSHRDEMLNKLHHPLTEQSAWRELRTVRQPVAYEEWTKCKLSCQGWYGFDAWKSAENGSVVSVTVCFHPPPGEATPVKLIGTIANGRVSGLRRSVLFAPGETLGVNESRTVLVHRIDPRKEVTVVIKSEHSPEIILNSEMLPKTAFGKAKLSLYTPASQEIDYGQVEFFFTTPNLPGKPSVTSTYHFPAPPGRLLRNPTNPTFVGPPEDIQKGIDSRPAPEREELQKAWAGVGRLVNLHHCQVDGDHKAVQVELDSTGLIARWRLTADEYELRPVTDGETTTLDIQRNRSFSFLVPGPVRKALLEVTLGGVSTTLAVGESSPDGAVKFLGKTNLGDYGNEYEYIVVGKLIRPTLSQLEKTLSTDLNDVR
ncbi:MAG TPA: hypothetical protein VGD78_11560 [Chthoniobacterales bacterium]